MCKNNINDENVINTSNDRQSFWKKTKLQDMTKAEWESLCDGCGRCCLVKLEDEDTSKILYTDVACTLFNADTCRCKDYTNRQIKVPECVNLTPEKVKNLRWLPKTCAYRLLAEGKDLYSWHPLVSGSNDTVHEAGISVRGRTSGSEDSLTIEEQISRIVKWPNQRPIKSVNKIR